jgi:hypothetical protein
MAMKSNPKKQAKLDKAKNTVMMAGNKKVNNTIDGAKSVPGAPKWSAKKAVAKTFTSDKKMKKPTK